MILLKGPRNQNQATGQWKGTQGLKARYLDQLGDQKSVIKNKTSQVHVIDTESWKDLDQYNQMTKLYGILEQ